MSTFRDKADMARSIGLIRMKRRRYIILSIVSVVVVFVLLGAGAFVVGQTNVSPQAIASSVTRTPELMERAWHLPVAATFNRQVNWQSNGSRCGPAAVANAYRSLGEATSTEGKVLAGTGRCWTGFCILGLTLDELADVARANTNRKITLLRDLSEEQFRAHLRPGPTLHRELQPGANIRGRRRTSFTDRRLSRGRGSGVHPRRQLRLSTMAGRE